MNNSKEEIMPGLIKAVDDYIYCYGYRQLKVYIENTVREEVDKTTLAENEKNKLAKELISELENKFNNR